MRPHEADGADHRWVDAANSGQGADEQELRHADAEVAGDELVPDEALAALQRAPGPHHEGLLPGLVQLRQREQALPHPAVQRHVGPGARRGRVGQQQGDRLGQAG